MLSRVLDFQRVAKSSYLSNILNAEHRPEKGNLNIYMSTYLIDLLFSHDLPQKPCKGNSRGQKEQILSECSGHLEKCS